MENAETVVADGEAGVKIGGDLEKGHNFRENLDDLAGDKDSKPAEKNICPNEQPSLRSVLTDPLTGLLMDDAMVAQCGHSFGLRSLQHVLETNLCISCGGLVPPESLVPNYALRAAVEAYGQEDALSRKGLQGINRQRQCEQTNVSQCKSVSKTSLAHLSHSDDCAEGGSDSKEDKDAFLVDDRVIIKANNHVPDCSVCRPAVITAKALYGWYTVKTLDIGESLQLPYRFLQKVGEGEMVKNPEPGSCLGEHIDVIPEVDPSDVDKGKGRILNGQTSSNSFHDLAGDQDVPKLLEIHVNGNEHENSEDDSGVSKMAKVPSQSKHDGGGDDIGTGTNHFSPEVTSGPSGADTDIGETKRPKRGRGSDGWQAGGILGTQAGLDVVTVRSKRSSLVTRGSNFRSGCLSSPGPKAFISGARKRSCIGNGTTLHPLVEKTREVSSLKTVDTKETVDVKCDVSNPGTIQLEVLQMIKKGMANLEKDIPWICFQRVWRKQRSPWYKGLRESTTLQELGIKLKELRSSLLLASAGGMPDEEWEKQLNTAKDSENTDLLIYLWRNFNDDVSKWMTAKAKRNQVHLNEKIDDDEYADLKKLFPTLLIEGFSPAGVTAAAAIAAAEAFSHEGSKNTEVLIKVPMKLIRQHNHHDLIVLREALEREKRHISAKLAVLETKECKIMNGFGESAGSEESMDIKRCKITTYDDDPHKMHVSIMSDPSSEFHEDAMSQEL
ncbi:hypothetical protein SUGI_0792060 [Cryptomeria japonica]|uniref:uncharacterized protein LOC131048800 n=1 Tax=Cryptomeria japonica TaxID=3369 RepID=UPI002414814D|nr:uncharacterized protein LOC131048800 [Cryptomeria japonica]GLJ38861.1 hypothetical protein SUGI_0792060 [Cryptomeria japonica]